MCDSWGEFYSDIIKDGDLVFDIGAYVGERTQELADIGARVIAVEPNPYIISRLRNNVGRFKNVVIEEAGVGSRIETRPLGICNQALAISSFEPEWKTGRFSGYTWDKSAEVSMITLDYLVGKYGEPKYCKIDVEGYEREVLKGLTHPIEYISFEYTSEFRKNMIECMDLILGLNPCALFNFTISDIWQFELPDWKKKDKVLGCAVLQGDGMWGDMYAYLPKV